MFSSVGLFACLSVCLSVNTITQKVMKRFLMKCYGGVRGGNSVMKHWEMPAMCYFDAIVAPFSESAVDVVIKI